LQQGRDIHSNGPRTTAAYGHDDALCGGERRQVSAQVQFKGVRSIGRSRAAAFELQVDIAAVPRPVHALDGIEVSAERTGDIRQAIHTEQKKDRINYHSG